MKGITLSLMAAAGLFFSAYGGLPVQDMSPTSLALDYSGLWRGEKITKQKVPGHENVQLLNLHYSPVPYCAFSLGLGAARYSVDTVRQTQFKGTYNFSPSLGITLFSPFLLKKILRFTAGAKAYYLYTRNRDRSYLYSGSFMTPGGGVLVSLGEYVDFGLGVRGQLISGRMQKGREPALDFSNSQTMRTYFTAMIHSPSEGAYFLIDFDASPKIDLDWSNGPAESSIGISVGIILRSSKEKIMPKTMDYPMQRELEKKLEDMEKELR